MADNQLGPVRLTWRVQGDRRKRKIVDAVLAKTLVAAFSSPPSLLSDRHLERLHGIRLCGHQEASKLIVAIEMEGAIILELDKEGG